MFSPIKQIKSQLFFQSEVNEKSLGDQARMPVTV